MKDHDQFWIDTNAKLAAAFAEQEAGMRECMSNRDNYTLDEVRNVVAYHEKHFGYKSNGAMVARAILAERLAELVTPDEAAAVIVCNAVKAKLQLKDGALADHVGAAYTCYGHDRGDQFDLDVLDALRFLGFRW